MSDVAPNSEAYDRSEKRLLIALITANALLRLVAAAVLPLLNEEAYYWEWSRFPSPG